MHSTRQSLVKRSAAGYKVRQCAQEGIAGAGGVDDLEALCGRVQSVVRCGEVNIGAAPCGGTMVRCVAVRCAVVQRHGVRCSASRCGAPLQL